MALDKKFRKFDSNSAPRRRFPTKRGYATVLCSHGLRWLLSPLR